MIKSIIFLLVFMNSFCIDLLDYDIDGINSKGPYNITFGVNQIYFNVRPLANASASGQNDCIVLNIKNGNSYNCYGQEGKTTYAPLADGSDGIYMTSKGVDPLISYISLVCNPEYNVTGLMFIDNLNFSATLTTPSACKGTGPNQQKKGNSHNGLFGAVFFIVLLVVIVLFFAVGALFVCLSARHGNESALGAYGSFVCYLPLLVKDGVKTLFQFVCGGSSSYGKV